MAIITDRAPPPGWVGNLGQSFLPVPAPGASAVRGPAQICSSLPNLSPSSQEPAPLHLSISPPVESKQVLVSSHLQQIQAQRALKLSKCRGRNWGRGSPALSSPSGASQLPPLSPPRDLAAVYSTLPPGIAREPQAKRRPHASPYWLGPDSAHCPTPPRPRRRPPHMPSQPGFRSLRPASQGDPGILTGYRSGN